MLLQSPGNTITSQGNSLQTQLKILHFPIKSSATSASEVTTLRQLRNMTTVNINILWPVTVAVSLEKLVLDRQTDCSTQVQASHRPLHSAQLLQVKENVINSNVF